MKLIFIILVLLIHKISTNFTPFQYQHILNPNDPNNFTFFGQSLSISGNTLAIGSSNLEGYEKKPGRAYIFENENNNWNQKARLNINDGTNGDGFGTSVSISNDIVVIGAPFANVSSNISQGKAYVFKKNGNDWNQVAELIGNNGKPLEGFGMGVSISGKTIAVGAINGDINETQNRGCVYIFNGNEDGTIWNQVQQLFSSDGADSDEFGWGVSISDDSSLILVTAPNANVGSNQEQGKAYIFQNNGTNWNETQILTASDGYENAQFGWSASSSSDFSFVVIGSPYMNVSSNSTQGQAYIFQKNGNQWNQIQILIASDGKEGDFFGGITSVSSDSSLIIIGAPNADVGSNQEQGKAYIFQNNGTNWNQVQILIASDGNVNDQFGTSVLISNQFAIVGASWAKSNNDEFIQAGKVYLIDNIPPPQPNTSSSSSGTKAAIIVAAIIIPIVIIVAAIFTIYFVKKKIKQKKMTQYYSKVRDEL
ncbi:hypothetical protein M0811_06426 [Anaeramoeba ignava]|uniref:Uncharacterized protein n=1 Tax=Anaeramoeba ignava TaxID=1746090 RepID=A0A9Q0LPL7_ANAIG|nr:hypothetical protein M0811_06426 [Anaeramoeba ignava]